VVLIRYFKSIRRVEFTKRAGDLLKQKTVDQYYLERRDPEFDLKMAQVLLTYKEVEMIRASDPKDKETPYVAVLSYDERPGIQAIQNVAPDLPPVPGKHPSIGRDYEYKRHGVVSLLAAIDLISGNVHGDVQNRDRSSEFTDFLKRLDRLYAPDIKIRMILDNHSSHISKETKRYLATVPNRFEFIFTPTHGSWLNIIETFFSKANRSFLRILRVNHNLNSKNEVSNTLTRLTKCLLSLSGNTKWIKSLLTILIDMLFRNQCTRYLVKENINAGIEIFQRSLFWSELGKELEGGWGQVFGDGWVKYRISPPPKFGTGDK
jgi:transposase